MRRVMSVDLGRARDLTALAVAETEDREGGLIRIVHLDQHPLGTDYKPIVDWVVAARERFPHTTVVVDVGEAGGLFLELLRERGIDAIGVRITGGEHESRDREGVHHVAKAILAGLLDVTSAADRLRLDPPTQKWAKEFNRQLHGYTRKVTPHGHARFESATEAVHDDLVTAVKLCIWYLERHAGVPLIRDFYPDQHVALAPLEAMPSIPITRGWWLEPPMYACVAFQIWGGGKEVQVLYAWRAENGTDVVAFSQLVLQTSATLFYDFTYRDYVSPDALTKPLPNSAGGKRLADALRPGVVPRRGEGALVRQLQALARRLTTYHGRRVAFQVDPREQCWPVIRALSGGFASQMMHGQTTGIPRQDEHAAVAQAFLIALAAPETEMGPGEYRNLMGPRAFGPDW